MRYLLLIAALAGCSTSPWKRADCFRYRMLNYNILACNDELVGEHCRKGSVGDLTGKPVTYNPRACTEFNYLGRKDTILVGKSYSACIPHEICHHENPNDPAMCEEKYPCIGDLK